MTNTRQWGVSIHALLAECDRFRSGSHTPHYGFNPRTPCGVRHMAEKANSNHRKFQSTHSLRSATNSAPRKRNSYTVSIHALLAECDQMGHGNFRQKLRFNPRTPCGVRLNITEKTLFPVVFQSTHSLRSATKWGTETFVKNSVSIHALLAECDMTEACQENGTYVFQSTHSLRSATGAAAKPESK